MKNNKNINYLWSIITALLLSGLLYYSIISKQNLYITIWVQTFIPLFLSRKNKLFGLFFLTLFSIIIYFQIIHWRNFESSLTNISIASIWIFVLYDVLLRYKFSELFEEENELFDFQYNSNEIQSSFWENFQSEQPINDFEKPEETDFSDLLSTWDLNNNWDLDDFLDWINWEQEIWIKEQLEEAEFKKDPENWKIHDWIFKNPKNFVTSWLEYNEELFKKII